jgi:hypothetical protein
MLRTDNHKELLEKARADYTAQRLAERARKQERHQRRQARELEELNAKKNRVSEILGCNREDVEELITLLRFIPI